VSTEGYQTEPNSGSRKMRTSPISEEARRLHARGESRRRRKDVTRLSPDGVFDAVEADVRGLQRGGFEQTDAVIVLAEKEREMLERQAGRPLTSEEEGKLHSDNTWRKLIKRRIGLWNRPGGMETSPAAVPTPSPIPPNESGAAVACSTESDESANEGRSPWGSLAA